MKSPAAQEQARKAERVLSGLLRTPKTRAGLIAAVTGKGISRHFVFGWLAHRVVSAEVVVHRGSRAPTYQLSEFFAGSAPTTSDYPAWLDPRGLPTVQARRVFSAGVQINPSEEEEQK